MGSGKSKVAPDIIDLGAPQLLIDSHTWNILKANPCYEKAFGHSPVGYNVATLMTYFVRKTHVKLLEKYRGSATKDMVASANAAMSAHRYMVINNGFGTTSRVKLWMEYDTKNTVKMNAFPINCVNHPHIPRNSLVPACTLEPAYVMEELPNRICIMMDLANSTKLVNTISISELTKLYFEIAKAIDNIVCKKYHPYARIHETAGDSVFIVVDSQYKHRCNMAISMVSEIIEKTNEILVEYVDVYYRCGMTLGDLRGGIIDGRTYRLFGAPINLAARLESLGEKNQIVFSDSFCELLDTEGESHNLTYNKVCVKGFDEPIPSYIFHIETNKSMFNRRQSFIIS